MSVRIGVDVGGTFTKAVACDPNDGSVVARSVVPTTHLAAGGLADGVIAAIRGVARDVAAAGLGSPALVAHSTTQAVNALLEGDTAVVGVVGIGRRPDLRRSSKRTRVGDVLVAPGRRMSTRHVFVDATAGLSRAAAVAAIRELLDQGAEVICASEAFGVDDARGEWMILEVAAEMGVPACAGHELTGLYGLEMRTVTAALNGSILPAALRTARLVEEAVHEDFPGLPLLVMRGDGGAAGATTMRRHPLLTTFSGPAASVAGALRHLSLRDGVVVEVGGTSTNVSTIRGGRPVLSYVRVLDHVTCVRSIDVRVVGVAGGSLARVGRRFGSRGITDVGPRSAHIAGLPYVCFQDAAAIRGAEARLIAPRPGDPADYLVLETPDGRRFAPTPTCAANALGTVPAGTYARGDGAAARAGFEAVGLFLGTGWEAAARAMADVAAAKIAHVVEDAVGGGALEEVEMVGLGGGAGALVPAVAATVGAVWQIPEDAEVISSVGDALSLVRVEVERTLAQPSTTAVAAVHHEAEAAAIAAGAAPGTIQVESEAVPERGALRVVAFGAVGLDAATNSRASLDTAALEGVAAGALEGSALLAYANQFYAVFTHADRFVVVDNRGSIALQGDGAVVHGPPAEVAAQVQQRVPALTRHYGPIAVAPAIRIMRGSRLVDLTVISKPTAVIEAVLDECAADASDDIVAFIARS